MAESNDDFRIRAPTYTIPLNVINDDDLLALSKFIMLEVLDDGHRAYEEVMNFFTTEESTISKVTQRIEERAGGEMPDELKKLITVVLNNAYRSDLATYVKNRVVYSLNFDEKNEMIWIRPRWEALILYWRSVDDRGAKSEKEFYEPLSKAFKSYSDDERLPEHLRKKYGTIGYYLENPDKFDEAPYWVLSEFFK